MVTKRSLANWRLLSSVVIGVVLASAIMAGTVIYFDSLRDLALKSALSQRDPIDLDILAKATKGPTTPSEYAGVRQVMEREYRPRLGWLLEDVIRGGRTATFYMTPPGLEESAGDDNARSYFHFLAGVGDQIALLPGGRLPTPMSEVSPDGTPLTVEAILPENAAEELEVGIGDTLSLIPHWTELTPYVSVEITGIYRRVDPEHPVWRLNDTIFHTFTSGNFRTAPFLVSESTLLRGIGSAFTDMDSNYGWMLSVAQERLRASNSTETRLSVVSMDRRLSSLFTSYRQMTDLDDALAVYDQRLLFTKLQMFVVLILIAVVVLYYVVTLSALVAEQRRDEIRLLQGRGATERQVLIVFLLEGATIAVLAIVIAPFLAAATIAFLGYSPAFSDLTGGAPLPVELSQRAFVMSAVGGVLSFAALMIPAFQASRSTISRSREESARPSSLSFFQRYYLDVMLLAVSIVLFRQLTEQGSLAATNLLGEVTVNQMLLAVPGIMLVAGAMVLLRLFPLVMALASRLLESRLGPGLVLGLWQMARNPTHYARLALLLILMAGLGIFAASFGGTLNRNFVERVLYDSGADIRLSGVSLNNNGISRPFAEPYRTFPGVEAAAPALRTTGLDLSLLRGDPSFDVLALDSERFADIAWYRDDFSTDPLPDVLSQLNGSAELPLGLELPKNARSIEVLMRVDRPLPTTGVSARLRDANGRYFTYPLGFLDSSNWNLYRSDLFDNRSFRFGVVPTHPLSFVSIMVGETDLQRDLVPGSVMIDTVRARTSTGAYVVLEDFRDIGGWNVLQNARNSRRDRARWSQVSARGDGSMMFAWAGGSPLIPRGIYPGAEPQPVPVVTSASFAKRFGRSVGDEFEVAVSSRRLDVVLADTIEFFPTLDSLNDRFMLIELAAVRARGNLGMTRGEISPNEVWVSTDLAGDERQELLEAFAEGRPFRASTIIDTEANLHLAQIDPLVMAGWRALLLMAFGAILILSSLGFLVHAYISFRNRELQFALMRTMGFTTRQLVSLMWLEQALVIAVGLALGTWMGGRLGATIMPFLAHDDRGSQVLPPFVIEVGWQNLLVTYVAMAVIFTAIVLGVIWFIRRMSLSRVLRLGDG